MLWTKHHKPYRVIGYEFSFSPLASFGFGGSIRRSALRAGRYHHAKRSQRVRRRLHHRTRLESVELLERSCLSNIRQGLRHTTCLTSVPRQVAEPEAAHVDLVRLGRKSFRYEGYHDSGFKLNNNDSYLLLRSRLQMNIRPVAWFKIVTQLQDSRPFMQKPPWGPPNLNAWDLKLAYAEFGDPETSWISVRVGRQLINYNNTIIANSEWRNQARSYDAVVANLHYDRYRLGLFGGSVVVPLAEGISHHLEGNNIYGAYGGIDRIFPNSVLEPFVLWRLQPSVAIETTAKLKTGKQDELAYGLRFKGVALGAWIIRPNQFWSAAPMVLIKSAPGQRA